MIYRKFKLDRKTYDQLFENEKRVLKILEEVVKDTSVVYEQQLKDGFYPKGVTKGEIEEAAKKKPSILSPFTHVSKKDGLWDAVPFSKKYAGLLEPIAEKIKKAASISTNQSFRKYLLARAKAILDESHKEADIAWLDVKNSRIDFAIGPFERYLDNLFFVKRAYQAHVGMVDEKLTKAGEEIKETLYSSAKISFDKSHSTDIPKKGVSVFVEDTPATSGYLANSILSGEHFPCDLDVMKKYGAKIILYRSHLELKFKVLHEPIFKAIFEKKFASKYSEELLLRATGWYILLYESSRQLHKFIGARERLKELYGPIDEANGLASGIQHAKYLLVKGLLSQDELEAMIILHIVWMFSDWLDYQKNEGMKSYVLGNAIALNTYLDSGALNEKNGISWPNFSRIFFEIEVLADTLSRILQSGDYEEAEKFIRERAGLQNMKRLSRNLNKLAI